MQQLMELDLPQHDKLYYYFLQSSKDAKKLYQSSIEMFNLLQTKGLKESFEVMVLVSKKLTDNAYFSEARLYN